MIFNLKEDFMNYIKDWQNKLEQNEWYFTNYINEKIEPLSSEQAFEIIPDAVDLIIAQKDPFLIGECLYLLNSITVKSNTTEMHPYLLNKWADLDNYSLINDFCAKRMQDLKKWYRK